MPKRKKLPAKKHKNSNKFVVFCCTKTETNEKQCKKVENTPLQLADNERVAKSSLEEKRIEEKRIEEIKRKKKKLPLLKRKQQQRQKIFFLGGLAERSVGEHSWLELQAIHSGLEWCFPAVSGGHSRLSGNTYSGRERRLRSACCAM